MVQFFNCNRKYSLLPIYSANSRKGTIFSSALVLTCTMSIFITGFWVLGLVCLLLFFYTRKIEHSSTDPTFLNLQRTYLLAYLFAMAGDWLQGPYVYALYDHYGMTTYDIEILFVAGFGSSMILGTFVGSFADKYGRRLNCMLYCVLYGLACVTKHFNNFWILMIGRLLGGVATSILYSAFESWLIFEHNKRGIDETLIGNIFSKAVLGNSVVAIISGLIAQAVADRFGYVAPFDVSLIVLGSLLVILMFTWSENYGDVKASSYESFSSAFQNFKTDHKVLCLGLIQSLFEGAMYTFVLEWTPALTPVDHADATVDADEGHRGSIPHGYIFAAFMVAVMMGSSLFSILIKYGTAESFMRPIFFTSAVALSTPVLFPGNQEIIFIGFIVFEIGVGIFWPAMSTMRSKYIPESTRATVMNICRIPLNFIVVIILTQNLALTVIFKCCVAFLLLATLCQHWLYGLSIQKEVKTGISEAAGQMAIKEVPDKSPLQL